jgi:hypothetical protein
MSPPATPAQLRQAYRNQEFQNVSMTRGQCPLMQKEVAIFPVRYALDESPEKAAPKALIRCPPTGPAVPCRP